MRERTVEALASERKSFGKASGGGDGARGEVERIKAELAKRTTELEQLKRQSSAHERELSEKVARLERENAELGSREAAPSAQAPHVPQEEFDALREQKTALEARVKELESTCEEQKKELSFQYSMGGKLDDTSSSSSTASTAPAGVAGAPGLNRPARRGRGRGVRPPARASPAERPEEVASDDKADSEAQATAARFTAAELQDKDNLPEGVDASALDEFLIDSEYERLFKMSKDDYMKLPKWKRSMKKKSAGLL
eukprot:TRINITY_DN4033_c0_g1_i3.p1 TRINITY_DN4033_c0_g1~~TRINITY_DN4033_c0_g1_i3.p1  ORF type:complete len:255 (-),score=100.32 TRINITY_DN4033_c0_g1_i3:207-971(-)